MLLKGRKAVVLARETKPGWNAEFGRGVVREGWEYKTGGQFKG